MLTYFQHNGTRSDPWGGLDTGYMEHNVSLLALDDMVVYEPCNFASNVAYYHVATHVSCMQLSGCTQSRMTDPKQAIPKIRFVDGVVTRRMTLGPCPGRSFRPWSTCLCINPSCPAFFMLVIPNWARLGTTGASACSPGSCTSP